MNRRRSDKISRIDASEVVDRTNCELIIDGYNLLHVTRFKPRGNNEGELRRCREGLLSLLAKHLPDGHHRRVTIVFDSEGAPKHLADEVRWQHLFVVYARYENSADDLIAQLIGGHNNPKQLVVVSSDHRVQVAADRKKATAIDSDQWFDAVLERPTTKSHQPEQQRSPTMSKEDLEAFRLAMDVPMDTEVIQDSVEEEFENPFPDGYFDDLDDLD